MSLEWDRKQKAIIRTVAGKTIDAVVQAPGDNILVDGEPQCLAQLIIGDVTLWVMYAYTK